MPKFGDKIFIDRDGEQFVNLVNFLRTGKFPILKNREEEIKFNDELNFWKTSVHEKKIFVKHFKFDLDWCAPTLNLSEDNLILKKIIQIMVWFFVNRVLMNIILIFNSK